MKREISGRKRRKEKKQRERERGGNKNTDSVGGKVKMRARKLRVACKTLKQNIM